MGKDNAEERGGFLTYAVPHLSGAIDVLVVQQPDGSLKASPFYVRFAKHASVGKRDKRVRITVNGVETDFHMQVGRTGEAYFVEEIEEDAPPNVALSETSSLAEGQRSLVRTQQQQEEKDEGIKSQRLHQVGNGAVRNSLDPEGVKRSQSAPALHTLGTSSSSTVTNPTRFKPAAAVDTTTITEEGDSSNSNEAMLDTGSDRSCNGMQEVVEQAVNATHQEGLSPLLAAAAAVESDNINNEADECLPSGSNTVLAPSSGIDTKHDEEKKIKIASLEEQQQQASERVQKTSSSAIIETAQDQSNRSSLDITTTTSSSSSSLSSPSTTLSISPSKETPGPTTDVTSSPRETLPKNHKALLAKKFSALTNALAGLSPVQNITDATTISSAISVPPLLSRLSASSTTRERSKPPSPTKPVNKGGTIDLSLCWHLLQPDMQPQIVEAIFNEHLVSAAEFPKDHFSLLQNPNAACRLGAVVVKASDAMPLIMAACVYGPEVAASMRPVDMMEYSLVCDDESINSPTGEEMSPRRLHTNTSIKTTSSWKDWLSFSWKKDNENNDIDSSSSITASKQLQTTDSARDIISSRSAASNIDTEDVPLDQEAALLTAAAVKGPGPSQVHVEEIHGIRRSATSGRPKMIVRRRGFVPPPHQLNELASVLKQGEKGNIVTFSYGKLELRAFMYLVNWDSKLVVSDVDGTITKSDVLGHLGHLLGYDWTHDNVAPLFSRIQSNGYPLLFLSSRSIAQASITRDYLHSVTQGGHSMPQGPVIISPDGLFPSLYREVVLRRPQEFKIRCLEDIKSLFPPHWNPFFAGFGNRDTDELSYMAVGVPSSRIFIINPKGELRKACSTVRTSTLATLSGLSSLVDSMFPALVRNSTSLNKVIGMGEKEVRDDDAVPVEEDYNDFHYWTLRPSIVIEDDEAYVDPEGAHVVEDMIDDDNEIDAQV